MKVILAQPRGFCAGVVRAVDIVERALTKFQAPVYVRHEIVHNRTVVDGLKAKGARFVDELDEIPQGAVTIFSAHGVSTAIETEAAERGLHVLDATCPLVTKVHTAGQRYANSGRVVLLIGHAGHAEVEGTLGRITGQVHLVPSSEAVAQLDVGRDVPVAYISQTTLSVDDTRGIIEAIKQRFSDVVGQDTRDICYATQNRQSAVRDLSHHVDLILVVGARNSSNSNRLCEVGNECGVPSYLVSDASALNFDWFAGKSVIGITAGASAPDVLVADVIQALGRLGSLEITTLQGIKESVEFRMLPELMDVG